MTIRGNLDNSEGTLEALLQVAVCLDVSYCQLPPFLVLPVVLLSCISYASWFNSCEKPFTGGGMEGW